MLILEPVTYPTDAPIPKKTFVTGKVRLSEEKYIEEYANRDSEQFKSMSIKIETAVSIYHLDISLVISEGSIGHTLLEGQKLYFVFLQCMQFTVYDYLC